MNLKTPDEVKSEFRRSGVSIAKWAVENGLNTVVVYQLLAGRRKGERGEAHRAAVMLGIKHGQIVETADFKPADRERSAA